MLFCQLPQTKDAPSPRLQPVGTLAPEDPGTSSLRRTFLYLPRPFRRLQSITQRPNFLPKDVPSYIEAAPYTTRLSAYKKCMFS
jgi:hypothetical protein